MPVVLRFRNTKVKRGTVSESRRYPNPAAVSLHDSLTDAEAQAGAGILGLGMQALKVHEDAFRVLWLDADAVIAHGEHPLIHGLARSGWNRRCALR